MTFTIQLTKRERAAIITSISHLIKHKTENDRYSFTHDQIKELRELRTKIIDTPVSSDAK